MTMTPNNLNRADYLVKCKAWLLADWSQYSDEELLILYQGADLDKQNQAFDEIFNRYCSIVDGYIKKTSLNEWEAKAALYDVWLKAMDKLKTFDYREIPLEHWFRSVAHKTVQEYYRKERREAEKASRLVEEDLKGLDQLPSLAEIMIEQEQEKEAHDRFFEACDTLPNKLQREIIILIYFHGITNSKQIGQKLGKSAATIRTYHCRALKKLAKYFKKQRGEQ